MATADSPRRRRGGPARTGAAASAASIREFEEQRARFRELLLANPNYFGNLKTSLFPPVLNLQFDTTFEEIGCVGYQPQFNRLEAVVFVKQEGGYGGGVCSAGTPEYVRFYLSFDDGTTWQDQGMVSFTAFDIPGGKPLEYDVTLGISPRARFCFRENLPLVRAILSWNNPPPPNDPDFSPIWGNVREARIQVDPLRWIIIDDLLTEVDLQLPEPVAGVLDPVHPIATAPPKPVNFQELQALYRGKDVPEHRFLFGQLQPLIATPTLIPASVASAAVEIMPGLEVKLSDIIGKLLETDGDTSFEELKCVGLNPDLDTLAGVLTVKLPNGYSGNLCSAGSKEYVAFWIDWGDGTGFTYAGTTSVDVHDINSIPPEGLQYAVFLPVDFSTRRQPCEKGARTARVRAILSWEVPPPPSDPDYRPVWGNREETLIHIKPGRSVDPQTHTPFIETVGRMPVAKINGLTGLANGASTSGFTAQDSPFGGEIVITGHLANPTNISGGAPPLKYRVSVSGDGGLTWQRLTNTFTVGRSQLLNGIWSILPDVTQSVDGEDFYEYREDLTAGPGDAQIFVFENILARWQTGGTMNGLWLIRIEAKDPVTSTPFPGAQIIRVRLDNRAPTASITITSPGGPCADFLIGGPPIEGTYEVVDEHFGSLNLSVQPALGGTFTNPVPLPRPYPLVPTTGETGTWSLDTTGMPRCGYVVRLTASDRTIVNSAFIGFSAEAFVGLCLRAG